MKRISLNYGLFALVDDSDFETLYERRWTATKRGKTFYAVRGDKNKKTVQMHAEIMKTPKGKEVDHINGNGLDNQRSNLRVVSHAENGQNRVRLNSNNKSGYVGVYQAKNGQWFAKAVKNRKQVHLGFYSSKREAIAARKNYANNNILN